MKNEIYIFSGLGADERVFHKMDFSHYSIKFVQWIKPVKAESIEEYARRISEVIKGDNPILIGLSFGGMMAVEVGKIIKTKKIIVVASAKTKMELPFYYRTAGVLRLHKLLPTKLLKSTNFLTNWFFGVATTENKLLLKQILVDTDADFLKWAIDKVATWKNTQSSSNTIHIHGSADKVLPLNYVDCDFIIEGGGHIMTLDKYKEIDKVVHNVLED